MNETPRRDLSTLSDPYQGELGKLAEALAKAQGAMKPAKKDSTNPFFKSSYADLASVWEACRAPLASNGLAVLQWVEGEVLVTSLVHSSGQRIDSRLTILAKKEGDVQSLGSTITYLRRYALAALVGVVAEGEDDDGEAASGRTSDAPARKAPPTPPKTAAPGVPKVSACPNCHEVKGVMKSPDAERGAWLCNRDRGGCGYYFA